MKKTVKIVLYILAGIAYLAYTLYNVYMDVKMHFGYEGRVYLNLAIGIIIYILTFSKAFRLKGKISPVLPFYFFAMAFISCFVGAAIPCCTGG